MIFCVEDDGAIRDIEVYTLNSMGLPARGLEDGAALWAALREETPQLLLLDVMLPGQDGVSILRQLRSTASTRRLPVIMATAKGAEYDKIISLELGADDYLVKPFGMMEMVARVKAVLRRAAPLREDGVLSCGPLLMEVDEHRVSVEGRRVELTLKEFEVLRLLLKHPGLVYTRDQLLGEVWGLDYDGETRTVDVHIRSLRAKLAQAGNMIATVRGLGYKLEV